MARAIAPSKEAGAGVAVTAALAGPQGDAPVIRVPAKATLAVSSDPPLRQEIAERVTPLLAFDRAKPWADDREDFADPRDPLDQPLEVVRIAVSLDVADAQHPMQA